MILGALWFKQEKDCDSEFFSSNSLSLHLGRIKMSRSKLKFKGRVIWTEKCGLTFHLSFIINFVHKLTTHRGRPLAMSVYQKNKAKETSFRAKKNRSKKKLNGNLYLSKSFLRSIFVKTSTFFALLHIFQFNLLISLTARAIFELSWLGVICDFSDTFLQSWACTTLRSTRRRGVICDDKKRENFTDERTSPLGLL